MSENKMTEHGRTVDRFVAVAEGDLHVVEDGRADAPALLLIHGSAGSTAWWDPMIPGLAEACRVIRVDLLGHGSSSSPASDYDIPAHARRVRTVLDRLGVGSVTVVGHSMGCLVACALAEQLRGDTVAVVLIDMGPSLDAAAPDDLLVKLLLTRFPGRLLWRLRNEATIRRALRSAFARPMEVPDAIVDAALGMNHRALARTSRGAVDYLRDASLPERLAALGVPLLVIFGEEDARYSSSSAGDYRAVPDVRIELLAGVGHTPLLEDPEATARLVREIATSAGRADRRGGAA
jgi:pimeloyl-ACP methyl ester carboxylesterase